MRIVVKAVISQAIRYWPVISGNDQTYYTRLLTNDEQRELRELADSQFISISFTEMADKPDVMQVTIFKMPTGM